MSDEIICLPTPPAPPPVYKMYLDVGAWWRRFGALKIAILSNTDTNLQAAVKYIMSLHWVDLEDPETAAICAYMLGTTIPDVGTIAAPIAGLTQAIVTSVLTTVPIPAEQHVLVKMYFS